VLLQSKGRRSFAKKQADGLTCGSRHGRHVGDKTVGSDRVG
jgi:hypothetical protein